MNAKVWDLFYEADKVREMLSRKIQEETLRTYLFTYSKVYNSISIVSRIFFFFLQFSLHSFMMIFLPDSEIFWRQYVHTLTFFLKNTWFYWFHEKNSKTLFLFFPGVPCPVFWSRETSRTCNCGQNDHQWGAHGQHGRTHWVHGHAPNRAFKATKLVLAIGRQVGSTCWK